MSPTPARSRKRRKPASPSDPSPPLDAVVRTDHELPAAQSSFWCLTRNDTDEVRQLESVSDVRAALANSTDRLWIDLVSPTRELLAELADVLALHPLVTEDILESNQRAKVELFPNAIHIVMFGLSYAGEVMAHEVDIVLGAQYLLTSHDADFDLRMAPVLKHDAAFHLAGGPDYVLWAIADWIVDGYFPVFDQLGDEIDELEADVMRRPGPWVVERLFQVRRDLLLIRHAVSPQREIFNQLTNRDSTLIKAERIVYFRDIYDHLIRLTDELDSYRELVSTTLDVYLSQVNNNLSEIMKRLTGVTVVLATIAAISGIFGMSEAGPAFQFNEAGGFWVVTATAITIALVIYLYFRRRNWI